MNRQNIKCLEKAMYILNILINFKENSDNKIVVQEKTIIQLLPLISK